MEQSSLIEDQFEEPEVLTPNNGDSKLRLIIALTIVAALVMLIAAYHFGWFSKRMEDESAYSGPPPAPVVTAHAQTMTMAPHTVLPGTVVSVRDAVIASEASGKILSVANIGDLVAAGDSIAEIDARDAEQMVEQRKAELAKLRSLLKYHSDYFERISTDDNKLGVSEIGIAELKSNRDTASADVDRAKAALRSAENTLARTSIKAPFSGTVVSRSIQEGEFAQVGSSVVRLVDTANLEVSAQVPAALVQPVESGTTLEINGMGQRIQAPLRALVPVGDSISRTMELRVSLPNSSLMVGSPVRVSLPSAQAKEVVAIPRDAVILRTESQYVFVVEDSIASRREVELGYAQGDMIEVIGDIQAQARVIVRGGERLRDGQSVTWDESVGDVVGLVSN